MGGGYINCPDMSKATASDPVGEELVAGRDAVGRCVELIVRLRGRA